MDLQEFKIPFNPLSKLTCSDVLDFQDYPIISLETNEAGSNFISYLVTYLDRDNEQRIVIPVSEFRLYCIRTGRMSIKDAFDSVEGGVVYGIHIHRGTGEVREAFLIPSQRFPEINPVASDYFVHALPEVAISMGDSAAAALATARDKHRVLLDLYVQGSELGAGVKPWAIDKVFLPTVRIVQEAFDLTEAQFNKIASYTHLKAASFGVTIELDYELDLFKGKIEFDKLNKLIALISSETKEDIDRLIPQFRDETFVKEYIKIIRAVKKHDLSFTSTLANPVTNEVRQSFLNEQKAQKIKAILDERFDEIVDIEEIEGVFLDVDFSIQIPSFALQEADSGDVVRGKISEDLRSKLTNDLINIKRNQYIFKIKTIYKPETTMRPESTHRVLLDYTAHPSQV